MGMAIAAQPMRTEGVSAGCKDGVVARCRVPRAG